MDVCSLGRQCYPAVLDVDQTGMTQTKYVQGAGGGKGGGGAHTTEADDTLQSIQFANVDLDSEGEIKV